MPAYSASAPGKIILFGEHAVVYGQPAIAVPLSQVRARAYVTANRAGTVPAGKKASDPLSSVVVEAPDIGLRADLAGLPPDHPLAAAILAVFERLQVVQPPSCTVRVRSSIPRSSGMGSGAAVSVAIMRALSAYLGHPLPPEEISALAYEVEKIHHGTPSGIDNSVVTFGKAVYFVRGQPIQALKLLVPFHIVVGVTGIATPTGEMVAGVRRRWQADPAAYEALFDAVGQVARQARRLIEDSAPEALGPLMDHNQALLSQVGVSCPELDRLVDAARSSGALGAKLSGGGGGGAMIALVREQEAARVASALQAAGAVRVIQTMVGKRQK